MVRAFFAATLVFSSVAGGYAGDVSITGVTHEKDGSIVLVFNNTLAVGGITVDRTGAARLKYPCYVSRRGVSYPQVKLLTRQAREAAEEAAVRGKTDRGQTGTLSYTVGGIRPWRGQSLSLKGFATVTFNNAIAVDCRIMMSRGRLWIAWPSAKQGETWRRLVTLRDRRLRTAIEKEIQAKFAALK